MQLTPKGGEALDIVRKATLVAMTETGTDNAGDTTGAGLQAMLSAAFPLLLTLFKEGTPYQDRLTFLSALLLEAASFKDETNDQIGVLVSINPSTVMAALNRCREMLGRDVAATLPEGLIQFAGLHKKSLN